MGLYDASSDQKVEYERIFREARDAFSISKDPIYLRVQCECLKQIRYLNRELMGATPFEITES